MSMKNSNETIGNQTHALPACSAVSQLTVPPSAPQDSNNVYFLFSYRPTVPLDIIKVLSPTDTQGKFTLKLLQHVSA
jgi:hypothetical protein